MRGCTDEGMSTNGHPFIRISGLSVVAVTVSTKQPRERRRSTDSSSWNSCFESNDVLKEYKTTFISKGRIDDQFCLRLLQDLIL
jgi:hypothetical protein